MGILIDMLGKKYGRLTVLEKVNKLDSTRANWKCVCDCGNTITISGKKLRSGHTKSCGCYRKEVTAPQQGLKNIHNTEYVKSKLKENGFELLSKYEGTLKPAKMKCLCCDLEFTRRIEASLYNTNGCPRCSKANNGFMQNETFERKPHLKDLVSSLYLIEFTDGVEHFWKVGITRRSVDKRIRKIPYKMVSFTTITGKLFDMYKKEKQIKRYNKEYRYYPNKFFNGHSECFSQPINIE